MSEVRALDEVEQRVLGGLLEKQRTVPASYPLTQNALRSACNQTSSREPVVDYDDRTLIDALGRLRETELVRTVWTGAGSRAVKYHQLLTEQLDLDDPTAALITLLLLRGPQSSGELRTRSERLHPFADRDAVEATLHELAERGLARELPARGGRQDPRWIHLLGPVAGAQVAEPTPEPVVVIQDPDTRDAAVLTAYDALAGAYADHLSDELEGKPFDRWLVQRLGREAVGPVLDVGCGPGQITAALAAAGADVSGLDLSPAMIDQARTLHPELDFEVGDLSRVLRPRTASGWGAVTAWYALVHLAPAELPPVIAGLARVLAPGGLLSLAVHHGTGVRHVESLFEVPVELDFVLHERDVVLSAVAAAGLVDIEWYLRSPLPGVEADTERLYVLARRPG